MYKHSDKIASNEIGKIRHCKYCNQVEVQIGAIVSYMSITRFTNLYLSLVDIKESVSIYDEAEFHEKLMITSPIKDTYFAFTVHEIKTLLALFEEALLMFEVQRILSE
ncbi:MAG: hypothetical protein N4A35_15010 [Flavobacteriales bacterium]|jgi:hypothetical protein|nr:hypothetical protein [Flavobacteriales bacterium]